mgnify:CR=1 FL=1
MAKTRFLPIENRLKKLGFSFIAGIDEAGRGPLAGPVVSAAVILKENARIPGLTDSKKLSKKKREELFELVIKNSLDYSISVVSHLVIDEVNILNAVRFANNQCIKHLKIKPDFVVIDGKDKQIIATDFQTIIKGDLRVKSIAAASVLAKVARDRIMEKYAEEFNCYDFEKHMGYGTRRHRELIRKNGPSEIHRKSFTLL